MTIGMRSRHSYEKLTLHFQECIFYKCLFNYVYTAQYCSISIEMKLHEGFKFIVEDQH